jgi:hypothetical protein
MIRPHDRHHADVKLQQNLTMNLIGGRHPTFPTFTIPDTMTCKRLVTFRLGSKPCNFSHCQGHVNETAEHKLPHQFVLSIFANNKANLTKTNDISSDINLDNVWCINPILGEGFFIQWTTFEAQFHKHIHKICCKIFTLLSCVWQLQNCMDTVPGTVSSSHAVFCRICSQT